MLRGQNDTETTTVTAGIFDKLVVENTQSINGAVGVIHHGLDLHFEFFNVPDNRLLVSEGNSRKLGVVQQVLKCLFDILDTVILDTAVAEHIVDCGCNVGDNAVEGGQIDICLCEVIIV